VIILKGERKRGWGDVKVLGEVCEGAEKRCRILARESIQRSERRLL
jgi:hypothetical protein